MTLAMILAFLTIFVAAPLSCIVALLLWRLSVALPRNRVVRAWAWACTALAVIVVVFAIVFINNDQAIPPMDPETTRILTRGTLLVFSFVTSVIGLQVLRRGS